MVRHDGMNLEVDSKDETNMSVLGFLERSSNFDKIYLHGPSVTQWVSET